MKNRKLLHLIFNIKKALIYPIYLLVVYHFMNQWITLGVERERKTCELTKKDKKKNER